MHPAVVLWWSPRQAVSSCGDWASASSGSRGAWGSSCGSGGSAGSPGGDGGGSDWGDGDGGNGSGFGVRRPLRFLAWKLELDERQVAELARILNELKTERAQAEVDNRRTVTAFADAVASEAFDSAKALEGAKLRISSAERLRDAVIQSLQQIHTLLRPDQRAKLAYLIRTGTLSL
jgi:Spy/CpxP family protein refolding chaperone